MQPKAVSSVLRTAPEISPTLNSGTFVAPSGARDPGPGGVVSIAPPYARTRPRGTFRAVTGAWDAGPGGGRRRPRACAVLGAGGLAASHEAVVRAGESGHRGSRGMRAGVRDGHPA